MNRPFRVACVAVVPAFALIGGCMDKMAMDLKGDMNLKGDLALKFEGPIQMKVDGPTIRYQGTYISESLLEQVQDGRTTGEWVLAVFGEPDERTKLSDGSEIWKWQYRPVEESAVAFSLFGGDKDKPRTPQMTAFVQVRDGVVVRKFRD